MVSERLVQQVRRLHGENAAQRLERWQSLIDDNMDKPEKEQLEKVNLFFFNIPNRLDIEHWGERNYWATPYELLISNGGDCEDFSIAKYFSLKALGVPEERIRITYVKAYLRNGKGLQIIPHMVLAYYPAPDVEPLILDNLIPEIRKASERSDLVPTYGFNALGLWKAREQGRGKRIAGTERVEPWQDLLQRMQEAF